MTGNWTFGQKVGTGFAATVLLTIVIGGVAIRALDDVVASKDRVITVDAQLLIEAETLRGHRERAAADARGFLLTGDPRYMDQLADSRAEATRVIDRLREHVVTDDGRRLIDRIDRAEAEHRQTMDRVLAMRPAALSSTDPITRSFDEQVTPKRKILDEAIGSFIAFERRGLEGARQAASAVADEAVNVVVGIVIAVLAVSILIAIFLTRTLGRQIGTAVGQVQSSSAELQAAANQQATGAKEQATAMNEITTTISELLVTSRQIAESAQRVAQVAGQTSNAARSGDGTVETTQELIGGIRKQVDLIVSHMMELGKKSQQIGAVLDIVSELAEQTNILAINASIEAAGAGETGTRFAVVAEEIRKLADRVTGSTKEIRGLIDDVRGSVNTTVMVTESGSKAVDLGAKHFSEVTAALKHIANLAATTTEAAREIELSTKQQTTAVEQVNVAIANVAQATRETEASSGQTLQTASELNGLSRGLLRLVRTQEAA
jgi:methyl-accepting chemotaxis protein